MPFFCSLMRHMTGKTALIAAFLALPLFAPLAQAAPNQPHMGRPPVQAPPATPPATDMPGEHSMRGRAPTPHGDIKHGMASAATYSDRTFLSGMIAHHEGAVEMTDQLLKTPNAKLDPVVVRWAQEIAKTQIAEINDMRALVATLGGMDKDAYNAMKRDMTAMLEAGKKREPNARFISLMIPHHAGAIEMSLPALLYSDNRKVAKLAQNIIRDQSEEIMDFRDWLDKQSRSI